MESPFRNVFGECCKCGYPLSPVWFEEEEIIVPTEYGLPHKTGRKRKAVDYLLCENCGHKEAVDDSFNGNWR